MPYDGPLYPPTPKPEPGDDYNRMLCTLRDLRLQASQQEQRAADALGHLLTGGSTTEAFLILHGAR